MDKITPDDIRYADLAGKRFNKRFAGKPAYIRLPESTKDAVDAVQEAVSSKRRLVVRSGGHCLEGFVSDPAVQVLIDMSLMTDIRKYGVAGGNGIGPARLYSRCGLQRGLGRAGRRSADGGLGTGFLSGALCGLRRCARAE